MHRFYDARRAALAGVEPNPAHLALARLEAAVGDDLLVVTQNIDDLHERAGSTRVLHMHGELLSALCRACGAPYAVGGDLGDFPPCPGCGEPALRPDIVWFGEMPYGMDRIFAALERGRPVRLDRHLGRGLPGGRVRAGGLGVRRAHARAQPGPERGQPLLRRNPARPGGRVVPAWVEEVLGWGRQLP